MSWATQKLAGAKTSKGAKDLAKTKADESLAAAKSEKETLAADPKATAAKLKAADDKITAAEKKLAKAEGAVKTAQTNVETFEKKLVDAKKESAEISKLYASSLEGLAGLSSESGMYSNATACVAASAGGSPNKVCKNTDAPNLKNLSGEFVFGSYKKGGTPPDATAVNKVTGGDILISAILQLQTDKSKVIDVNQWRGGKDIYDSSKSPYKFKTQNSQYHIFFKKDKTY